jgi:hypothetical protein
MAQPVQPQRIAADDPVLAVQRQKLRQRILLPAIQHVALELRDDQRQARDLGRKVAQLDAPKVGQRNLAAQGASPRRRLISASISASACRR